MDTNSHRPRRALPSGGAALCLAFSSLALPLSAQTTPSAPEPSLPKVTEAVTVVGSAPDSVGAAAIRESPARDAGEALATAAGLFKLRKGGIANDVVVRGAQSKDLNVLVDGQRIYGACPSHMDPPAVHADFAEVERIDVVKGPFDVRNQGSLGGLVEIVTKSAGPGLHAAANLATGAAGYVAPSVTASFGGPRVSGLAGFAGRRANAYRDGAGRRITEYANYRGGARDTAAFDAKTVWGKLAFSPAPGHAAELSYTHQEMDDVLYPALQMDADWDRADRMNLVYTLPGSVRVQAYQTRVNHFMTDAQRTSAPAASPRGFSMATAARTRTTGARVEAPIFSGVTAGVEAYRRSWETIRTMFGMGGYRESYSIPGSDTDFVGIWLDGKRAIGGAWSLGAGVRVDRAAASADEAKADRDLWEAYHGTRATARTNVFASGNVRLFHRPAEGAEVSLGVGSNVRTPEPNERYLTLRRMGTDWVGNPDLAPSRSSGADLALSVKRPRLWVSAALFASRVNGYVTVHDQPRLVAVPGVANTSARSYGNENATLVGGEAGAVATLRDGLFLSGDVSYVRGSQDADPSRGILSTNLAETPPLRFRTSLRYDTGALWTEVEGVFSAAQRRVAAELQETPTAGWGIANLKVGGTWRGLTATVGIGNLFDRFYEEHLSYQRDPYRSGVKVPEPGRNVFANLGWQY